MKPKILAFAGSTRKDSFNKKTAAVAAEGARKAGAEVTLIDLKDFPMPLYDGDLELAQGLPENAKKLKKLFLENQALLIATPEYNAGMTGVLKNALDWVSRSEAGETPMACYKNKVAALVSASPGGLGGMRSLAVTRAMLEGIGVLVIPAQLAVSKAHEAFNPDGSLKDAKQQASLEKIGADLTLIAGKLA